MPYLKLVDLTTQHTSEIRVAVARLGRSPDCDVVPRGDSAGVVSGVHAELRYAADEWRLTDLASRNGTFVNGRRLTTPTALRVGDVIALGASGPRLSVVAVSDAPALTVPEHPAIASAAPAPARTPVEARAYGVTLLDAATGHRYEARGVRIRLGRGHECEVHVDAATELVSRLHAELAVGPSGALVVRDAGSRNGTFLNDQRVAAAVPVRLGDRLTLGRGGPTLVVEALGTAPQLPAARAPAAPGSDTMMALISRAVARAKEDRRQGKRGSTAFLRAVVAEVGRDSRRKVRWLAAAVLVLTVLLGGAVYGVYWLLSSQVAETEQAQRTAADSARAETDRLRRELEAARAAAAPAAELDSLRAQLESARTRTAALGAALDRAQTALSAQLAQGEARRLAAQNDVQRLRDELAAAERRAPSQAAIDSLKGAVTSAERETQGLEAKLRAVRAADFATIAQQNQGAVGLITASFGRDYYNGTGFVLTPDGYMLTNWHVVADSQHARADTLWVIMADQSQAHYADIIALSQERDLALVKVRGYAGPAIAAIDWAGTQARQGEPAALIGYPAGAGFAHLRTAVVRTSMTAGIISRTTEDVIQFDGITIGGSSGSPMFNANGQVIAIHHAGLAQSPGFALAVPIKHAAAILPVALRQRLGIP
ncbi:MAG TPA: FHA domain-containing protein [Gemmatimonadales bacterium]|nr:FHA domain-containing protein [Gemmatimonadales bacterium]